MSNVHQKGFTLIELLVVLAIMGLMLTIVTVDLNGQRANRSLTIAQNELVTNLRSLQSYSLSSRNINGNQPVQYYVAKFDAAKPDQYTLQAIYNVTSAPVLQDIQTVKFPAGVKLAVGLYDYNNDEQITQADLDYLSGVIGGLSGFSCPTGKLCDVNGSGRVLGSDYTFYQNNILKAPPDVPHPDPISINKPTANGCVLVAFRLPFSKIIMNDGCSIASPPNITGNDDYQKIINFVVNSNPPGPATYGDSVMGIILNYSQTSLFKTITIKGMTGAILFK